MSDSNHAEPVSNRMSDALTALALALGLVRALTRLPLHDPTLELVESKIADAYEQILSIRHDCEEPS